MQHRHLPPFAKHPQSAAVCCVPPKSYFWAYDSVWAGTMFSLSASKPQTQQLGYAFSMHPPSILKSQTPFGSLHAPYFCPCVHLAAVSGSSNSRTP